MLYGYFGYMRYKQDIPKWIDTWFTKRFRPEWNKDNVMVDIIRVLDNSEYMPPYNVISPVMGSIPIDWISGTAKTVIQAINMPDNKFPSSYIGDNGFAYMTELGKKYDMHIVFDHLPDIISRNFYFPQYDITVNTYQEFRTLLYSKWDDFKEVFDD